jgi:hypothetical protein
MMNTAVTSQVVNDIGIGSSEYIGRKTARSVSSSSPLAARRIKNYMPPAMNVEDTTMDRSRRSPSSDLSEGPLEDEQSWSSNMDIDSDDQGHNHDDEVEPEGSVDMDMSE